MSEVYLFTVQGLEAKVFGLEFRAYLQPQLPTVLWAIGG